MSGRVEADGLVHLTDEECWRFLERHALGRVALVHLENPMVFPVNYALDGRSIVFRTGPGTKLSRAAAGDRVAFEVDEASELSRPGRASSSTDTCTRRRTPTSWSASAACPSGRGRRARATTSSASSRVGSAGAASP